MDYQLKDKTVLVTGSNRGTGRIIAEQFMAEGAQVIFHSLKREDAAEISQAYDNACVVSGDICEESGCEQVADALDLEGAINIQLRIDNGEPVIFEINPRFSSTVGFRHRLGFTDGIWAIEARLGLEIADYTPPAAGTRIERVAQEVIRPPLGT